MFAGTAGPITTKNASVSAFLNPTCRLQERMFAPQSMLGGSLTGLTVELASLPPCRRPGCSSLNEQQIALNDRERNASSKAGADAFQPKLVTHISNAKK